MNNKRIGMAINYDYFDYGGMLQAYALFRRIQESGYAPEAINIDALCNDIRLRKIGFYARNLLDSSIVKEKSQIVFKEIKQKLNRGLRESLRWRANGFDGFCREKFVVSERYSSWEALSDGCKKYRAVVVGSDQLWLPSNIAGDYYTLSFVPSEVKKVAYATSFGVSKIAKSQEQKAKEFLNRIDYLSAREGSGQDIIRRYTGREVPLVCDPALLLTIEEWNEEIIPGRMIEEPYIFCYFMGSNKWHREFARELKALTGYKIVALLHLDQYIKDDEEFADKAPYDVSPVDFISLVKHAEYVCTDSYHGTVFSALFCKRFFTFTRFSDKATLSTNSRITTLLRKLGAEDRLVKRDYCLEEVVKRKIDYESIRRNIDEFRMNSMRYLSRTL